MPDLFRSSRLLSPKSIQIQTSLGFITGLNSGIKVVHFVASHVVVVVGGGGGGGKMVGVGKSVVLNGTRGVFGFECSGGIIFLKIKKEAYYDVSSYWQIEKTHLTADVFVCCFVRCEEGAIVGWK